MIGSSRPHRTGPMHVPIPPPKPTHLHRAVLRRGPVVQRLALCGREHCVAYIVSDLYTIACVCGFGEVVMCRCCCCCCWSTGAPFACKPLLHQCDHGRRTQQEAGHEGVGHARGSEERGGHGELHEGEGEGPAGEEEGDGRVENGLGAWRLCSSFVRWGRVGWARGLITFNRIACGWNTQTLTHILHLSIPHTHPAYNIQHPRHAPA